MANWATSITGVILGVCVLTSCATTEAPIYGGPASQAPVAEAPYRMDYQGWLTVDAYVNGEGPHDFIVDSGATITAAFANLAGTQQFQPANREPIQILGLSGARALPAYEIGEISVSGVSLTDHVGVILPDWDPPARPPQGVLGLDLLSRYKPLISHDERTIKLYDPAAIPDHNMEGWTSAPLIPLYTDDESRPLYQTVINIRGAEIPCIVDLGASGTVFNVSALRRMTGGVHINSSRRRGIRTGTRIQGIFDNPDIAASINIARLQIGQASWLDRTVIVYDAQIFRDMGINRGPFCLLGADILADRSVMLDFQNERIFIERRRRG
ncbi:retroviral-like aspartic protease family protein [Hyphococcus flavus]|uniref:Retroviral-like aspartic protease family protein n=1 Tax=Hyphococcus flavus TaxID=1866326 RepID=A0AAF0CH44_9PROT|nr:aspartyl protease family protein [Hyphococcus flavus]WDI33028.1 retroviral-like aspartic protease family protein [Hyphococcus flavus]